MSLLANAAGRQGTSFFATMPSLGNVKSFDLSDSDDDDARHAPDTPGGASSGLNESVEDMSSPQRQSPAYTSLLTNVMVPLPCLRSS